MPLRNICFVTGTRAEFGLMRSTLQAIATHPKLNLQIVATGMHLDRRHGNGVQAIRRQGWTVDAIVRWKSGAGADRTQHAVNMGRATATMAETFAKLKTDIVLVVGDRVEAFAAAAAGQVGGLIVAHVHGGDRAAGQSDDSLRHAITKLSHVHFPATALSRKRLIRMGEDDWRVKQFGSPGVDGIVAAAAKRNEIDRLFPLVRKQPFALLVHHPVDADDAIELNRMNLILDATAATFDRVVVIHPNNDPGSAGIRRAIDARGVDERFVIRTDVPRDIFLGLMRDASVLVGNSSSGIIEAASFGLPVVDIGDRQKGRERGDNVIHVPYSKAAIQRALNRVMNGRRPAARNIYGGQHVGQRIARHLASLGIDDRLRRKLIAY